MLQQLKIQNYAIINEVEIDFSRGLNVITGETGAGKSILLGALGLILGNRVDGSILKNNDKKCVIEGFFDIGNHDFKSFFEENSLDFQDPVIIRREISSSGISRAFINDTPVNLNVLKEFSENMIDIHSQNQTIQLNNPSFQLAVLDSVSDTSGILVEYKKIYRKYQSVKLLLSELENREKKSKKDLDYMLFQFDEISKASLYRNENEELEKEFLALSNAEKIKTNLVACEDIINANEFSVFNQLTEVNRQLNEISPYHDKLQNFAERLVSLMMDFKDLSAEIRQFEDKTDLDQERLDYVSNRLNLINHLLNKHQLQTVNELLEYARTLEENIKSISSMEDQILNTRNEAEELFSSLKKLSDHLSEERKKNIPVIEKELTSLLKELGMKNASVRFELSEYTYEEMKETGRDKVSILFTSNPGMPLQAVSKIASGGELSRLMLGVKYIIADTAVLPTIIFDEIDMGISGEIAIKVGQILKKLSKNHQLINISHLPQIAAMGGSHFLVYKEISSSQTKTLIRKLSQDERVMEIAKMIGGEKVSNSNIETSRELIERMKN